MKKIRTIGWVLLGGGAVTSLGVYVQTRDFSRPFFLSAERWVEKCLRNYPEIGWLANAKVRQTEEGCATLQGTYSEQLFGQKFIEFDRTLMTIRCLHLILEGSDRAYGVFTSAQPDKERLSRDSFRQLHEQGVSLLDSRWQGLSVRQMVEAMETALVLGDIGKSEKARKVFKVYGIGHYPDHDDFHEAAMRILEKNPSLSPSFARLSPAAKSLLVKTANLIHYGHVTHLEGQADMFSKLKQSGIASQDPVFLSFDLFVHLCDTAGALGHVNNQSSLVYTEQTHQALQAVKQGVEVLSDSHKTEWDAYHSYLAKRASWLGFNPEEQVECVLTRMGAMLRLFTLEEGNLLKKAFFTLDQKSRERIISQFSAQSISAIPTYMPALLVNLSNHPQLGHSKEERLTQAVVIGMPFIARVLERHQERLASHEADPTIPLNFNEIAAISKINPLQLDKEFFIDNEGFVHTQSHESHDSDGMVKAKLLDQEETSFKNCHSSFLLVDSPLNLQKGAG